MEMFNKISYQIKNKTDKNYRNKGPKTDTVLN